jgi:hypothetical protein
MTGPLTHGHTRGGRQSPTYNSWMGMIDRCTKPNHIGYATYGGRGIKVCERWRKFADFLADMGERPEGKTLDRIDSYGNYEPGNCRWATTSEQMLNRPSNRLLTFEGRTMPITAWAKERGLTLDVLRKRLRLGWSVERALTDPTQTKFSNRGGKGQRGARAQ